MFELNKMIHSSMLDKDVLNCQSCLRHFKDLSEQYFLCKDISKNNFKQIKYLLNAKKLQRYKVNKTLHLYSSIAFAWLICVTSWYVCTSVSIGKQYILKLFECQPFNCTGMELFLQINLKLHLTSFVFSELFLRDFKSFQVAVGVAVCSLFVQLV